MRRRRLRRAATPFPPCPPCLFGSTRPAFDGAPVSESDRSEFLEFGFEQRADFVEARLASGFEAHHKRGLGVGCAHETPSVVKLDADAVDVDDLVVFGEELGGAANDVEFPIV